MDLEDFEQDDGLIIEDFDSIKILSAKDALQQIDMDWWSKVCRRARRMDLIGDYAGTEPFVLDGEALLQLVLDDPLLALACPGDVSIQIIHALESLERVLHNLDIRNAVYDIVFWTENRFPTILTGESDYVSASRILAREMLKKHLHSLHLVVHEFQNISDPDWISYERSTKPMFVMTNDGGLVQNPNTNLHAERVLSQRIFLMNLLTSGIAVTLLKGADFIDSKIMSFVFESRLDGSVKEAFPTNFFKAQRAAKDSLQTQETQLRILHSVFPGNMLKSGDSCLSDIAKLYLQSNVPDETDRFLLYAFLATSVLLGSLSVAERARGKSNLHPELSQILLHRFLPKMYLTIQAVLSVREDSLDIDGRLYAAVLRFLLEHHELPRSVLFGEDLLFRINTLWTALELPDININATADRFPLPKSTTSSQIANAPLLRLMPFENAIFNDAMSAIQIDVDEDYGDDEAEAGDDNSKSKFKFGQGVLFSDTTHWHNSKEILPKHLGGEDTRPTDEKHRRKILKGQQRFMATLQRQAGTLTGALGASLTQIVITSVASQSKSKSKTPASISQNEMRNAESSSKNKKVKPEKLSSADKLRQKIQAEKNSTQETSSALWWKEQVEIMKRMSQNQQIGHLDAISRNKRSQEIMISNEIWLFRLNLAIKLWVDESSPEDGEIVDRHTLAVMRIVKRLCDAGSLTPTIQKHLADVLLVTGFTEYAESLGLTSTSKTIEDQPLSFTFAKLVRSKTKAPIDTYSFMKITESPVQWQLRLFGEYMDRSMDSEADRRVAFSPDAWQRNVLDCIDDEGSILVVAPTSAGKTFISYYAMEKVLRGSDDGIIVYVAPTKALVTQIAAEVYARFSKDLNSGSCWAIHTRDYRVHNPQKCQILVTVPEMLAIMLLSPPLARVWTPRIKRIILDEIHSIGQQEGGAVWEQIILLAPCPIIGLSATVGSPEVFNKWLESVQTAHGFKHRLITHPHRYSHLRKFYYALHQDTSTVFRGVGSHRPTGRMRFLHPISLLSFGTRSMPSDLALESSDALSLYQAFVSSRDQITVDIGHLQPDKFFSGLGFLRQKDILRYEEALKDVLKPLIASADDREVESPLLSVIKHLEDPVMKQTPKEILNMVPSRERFKSNLIHFVADLDANGDLPAILFNFDRSDCEIMAEQLLNALEVGEEKFRKTSPEWIQKVKDWESWKLRSKERERLAQRATKQKKDPDAPDASSARDSSWESSFDPEDPSPQFSFAGTHTSYSKEERQDDMRDLTWTSTPQWAIDCLRRGIAVHHAGMNKRYRSLVESLFRARVVRVVIATGTLALGINAPTKTSAFCGDSPYLTALMYRQCAGRAGRRGYDLLGKVVFYGLPLNRVQRLVLSKLPSLGGNFPLTSTMSLRLFNLLEGSENADVAVKAIKSILALPQISFSSEVGQHQLLHHLRFSIDYLRRARLLDATGKPMNLSGVASHLFYTEPSNLALVALLRNGVLHKVCQQSSLINAKRDFIVLMANLFGRRYLPESYATEANLKAICKKSPSIVKLPPLTETARKVLVAHNREILQVFTAYAVTYVTQYSDHLGTDDCLPVSQKQYSGSKEFAGSMILEELKATANPVRARSSFVANSGHDDSFHTVTELTRTARRGLHLNDNAIPSMEQFISTNAKSGSNRGRKEGLALNAYLLDFYVHGQVAALAASNGIRRGDVWYALQDFTLSLMTIRGALEQLLMKASRESTQQTEGSIQAPEADTGYGSYDPAEMDSDDKDVEVFKRPSGVGNLDWKVYEVVDGALREFEEKFQATWA